MLLQRGMKIPVWGFAESGEKVTVTVAGKEQSMMTGDTGRWRVVLDPIESVDPIVITIAGKNTIALKDVLVGEVWVCSGQSNMSFPLKSASDGAKAIKSANRPHMRLFTVGRAYPDQPQEELTGQWEVCTPQVASEFSAVSYFFGVDLQQNLNVPIGLIEPSWGGTRAEAWMPRATFDALKLPYEPEWTNLWLHPKPQAAATQPEAARPYEAPAVLFNGMIAPISGFAIRGVIWYQGETNTAYAEHYRKVLTALITSWREVWKQGDFPFLVVQLANLKNSRFWPTLRAAQAQVAHDLPNVGLAVTIDVGNSHNIHPTDKQTVGNRLAAAAMKIAYEKDVPYSGPTFRSMRIEGGSAVIGFDHVNGGLVAKGDSLEGFEIAGADGKFVPAQAKIDGEKVVVSAEGVASPTAVRYGWANDPRCTLYNKADLPAVPFEAKQE